eukprot:Colp12_sorted_trinity150504_noHs@15164
MNFRQWIWVLPIVTGAAILLLKRRKEKMAKTIDITTEKQFDEVLASNNLAVVHFWASWAEPCKQMNEVLDVLSNKHSNVKCARIEAENLLEISEKCEIAAVPTFVFFKQGKIVDRLNGANAPELTSKTAKLAATTVGKCKVVLILMSKFLKFRPVVC